MNSVFNKKKKRDSNGMIPASLKPVSINNKREYLNVSISIFNRCAGMAEWSTQSIETRCPSGQVGSIPTPGAVINLINTKR
jgi:hypothetical protein